MCDICVIICDLNVDRVTIKRRNKKEDDNLYTI